MHPAITYERQVKKMDRISRREFVSTTIAGGIGAAVLGDLTKGQDTKQTKTLKHLVWSGYFVSSSTIRFQNRGSSMVIRMRAF